MGYKKAWNFSLNVILFLGICSYAQSNLPPEVDATGDQPFCPGTSINIAETISITDPDDTGTESMYIQISEGYQAGQETLVLTGSHPNISALWDAGTGKLELTSVTGLPVPYPEFEAAIAAVQYNTTNLNATGERQFSITWGSANYLPSTEHFYEFVPDLGITWTDARDAAELRTYFGLQGYLATLTSQEEADLSGEQAEGTGWIGASDAAVEGIWRWVTGPEAGLHFWTGVFGTGSVVPGEFEFWNSNEPNNLGNEDYAHITDPSVGNPDGSWNDLANTGSTDPNSAYHPQGYIVEYGGMPGDPDINISASTRIFVPTITTTTVDERCGIGSVTLEATSDAGEIFWFDSSSGGNLVFTGNTFNTPSLNNTTIYYVAAGITGCTTGVRTAVQATIKEIPTIDSTVAAVICHNGTGTINATPSTAATVNWYDAPSGGILVGTGNSFTSPTLTVTTFYYAEAELNGCFSTTRTAVEITVLSPPAPTGDALQNYCDIENATIADLTTTTGINIVWYDAPTGGTAYLGTEALINGNLYYASQNDGTCESIDRLTVEAMISETVVATVITPYELCDDTTSGSDTDGFSVFDLTSKESELLNGQDPTLFTIQYYTDAGYTNEILTPASFQNSIMGGQPIFVRLTNNNDNSCYTDTSFDVVVFSLPSTNTPNLYTQCDDASNDGIAAFNLSSDDIKAEIAPNFMVDNLDFTYYNSLVDAETPDNAIPNPESYSNQTSFVNETVWIRIENTNGCYRVETIELEVTPSSADLVNYNPAPLFQCDDGADIRDGIATFDMTAIHDEIRDVIFSTITVTVHFYETQMDAELENNEIVDIANHQNTNSQNVQDIWVRVKSDLGNTCLGLKDFQSLLNVEALPFANPVVTEMKECDDDFDGLFLFDTSMVESEILNGQDPTTVSITYFDAVGNPLLDANGTPVSSPFTSFYTSSQTITYVVTNNNTNDPDGPCSDSNTVEFTVDVLPVANPPITVYIECDDEPDPIDGITVFDTSTLESEILNGQTGFNIFYYDANGDQLADSNGALISQPFPPTFSTSTQTITVVVENPANTNCPATITVDFKVNPNPIFDLVEEDMVCENQLPHFVSVENPDQADYLYQWFDASGNPIAGPDGTSQVLTITTADDITETGVSYSVTVTNPTTLCTTSKSVQLWKSSNATITEEDIIKVEFSSPENSIEIITDNLGSGDYEFSLEHPTDYRSFQVEPLFTNLVGGIYTLIVNDKNGCGQTSLEIVLLDYPKFLTPNNDGANDTWKLVGIESASFTVSQINIYDRFGKLLAVVDPYGDGWDGYYNGEALPSTDYWFSLQLTDLQGNIRTYRGNFSLIRR
ncbi:hypothetical protein KH5_22120 [Urechidicola sp. KH5]